MERGSPSPEHHSRGRGLVRSVQPPTTTNGTAGTPSQTGSRVAFCALRAHPFLLHPGKRGCLHCAGACGEGKASSAGFCRKSCGVLACQLLLGHADVHGHLWRLPSRLLLVRRAGVRRKRRASIRAMYDSHALWAGGAPARLLHLFRLRQPFDRTDRNDRLQPLLRVYAHDHPYHIVFATRDSECCRRPGACVSAVPYFRVRRGASGADEDVVRASVWHRIPIAIRLGCNWLRRGVPSLPSGWLHPCPHAV
mmetsp:Transcript_19420/g.44599  ORF Transcript_19420/g.44599 Transcript_19420/m.44599 type:complete len:251 (+) Transcript_19420:420-1172(+)